jgi:small multidrug resistance family-3 protein
MRLLLQVVVLFVIAGLAEIGGGWLVWQWLRAGRGWTWGLAGGLLLLLYGIIPTWQPETNFGRVYAAYGGIFVALSLLWGWRMDGWIPDRYDLTGAAIVLLGVTVILWPSR